MAGYRAPKQRLHREFLYLTDDTVVKSLSAIEAGKVDEIIQKVNEAREGGFDLGLGAGAAKAGASKKKTATMGGTASSHSNPVLGVRSVVPAPQGR